MGSKQFGGKLTARWKSEYQVSENWRRGSFRNLVKTQSGIDWKKLPGMLCRQIKGHERGRPDSPLPIIPFDRKSFLNHEGPQFIWYGHSVVLMRLRGQTVLIDPMFGGDASPIAPVKTGRFSDDTLELIDSLPEIDLLLITHDHYDHLDYHSILKLREKTKHYFVALGVKRHLMAWGVREAVITEFDWWDTRGYHDLQVTFTPTRHFSGRGVTSMAKCLWGGWALKTKEANIWFSGDGGYGTHFKHIGEKLGPFDFGFMECGQYCQDWPDIHLFPHESVQAALDAKVKKVMPVHWAGFNLSYAHSWAEPVEEFIKNCQQQQISYTTPQLGQLHQFKSGHTSLKWWEEQKNTS